MRRKQQDQLGWTIIAAVALCFTGMFYGAYKIDQARGITVGQSLAANGL